LLLASNYKNDSLLLVDIDRVMSGSKATERLAHILIVN
jgi:hypothetical protein